MSGTRDRLAKLSTEQRAVLAERLGRTRVEDSPATSAAEIVPRPEDRFEPFPLTTLQEAYWVGRSEAFSMGRVATHAYREFESHDLDIERLTGAWRRLVARHDMLRAVFGEDGTQRVLQDVEDVDFPVEDLADLPEEETAGRLAAIREEMSHRVPDSSRWPLFELRAARLRGAVRVFFSIDALIVDAGSVEILFDEWAALYADPEAELPGLSLTFRDYVVAATRNEEGDAFTRAREYWLERIASLPAAPDLPLQRTPESLERPRFVRRGGRLEAASWTELKRRSGQAGLTATGVLLAAYADVLALWSARSRFTLSVPESNRLPIHPEVSRVVGEFASFTLLEVDVAGEGGFAARARRHQERLWEDLDCGEFDGVRVLRELQRRSGAVQMPVIFTSLLRDAASSGRDAGSLPPELGRLVFGINQTSQVWLDNHLRELDGGLAYDWDTVDELFPPDVPAEMHAAFLRHLERLATDASWWDLEWVDVARGLLPPHQIERRDAVNATEREIVEQCLHELVEARAAEQPDAPAVSAVERSLTYGELEALADVWAERLGGLGAAPDRRVAIVMNRGWETVVAMLAVLKTGAACMPLDPANPSARLETLLRRGAPACVLTQSDLDAELTWPPDITRLVIDGSPVESAGDVTEQVRITAEDVAVVLYTSGSTGEPKAVMISHRSVVNAVQHMVREFEIGPDDRAIALTALHHDLSLFDLFGMLSAGGTVVMPATSGRRDPAHWDARLRDEGVTIWNTVPATMQMLLEYLEERDAEPLDSLRVAILGGDWIPLDVPERLRSVAPEARVISIGGPTETTIWNIMFPIERVDPEWTSIPYGSPITNSRYYVLDEHLVDRPDWVAGELWSAGAGLMLGYLDDETATRERFASHPRTGDRIYRTGDRGRYRDDGTIEFLGRVDFQVKIAGQRIELGEIEAHLVRHEALKSAVVTAVGADRTLKRLVAHCVPVSDGTRPDQETLGDYLSARLPDHMVPTSFVFLEELPLTPNGKVDRSALSAAAPSAGRPPPSERPVGDAGAAARERIVAIAGEVLGLDSIDPAENLLRYGANSIDMVRIANRLEEAFGHRPPIDEIFRLQTIDALAAFYSVAEDDSPEEKAGDPILDAYNVSLNPEERDAFKAARHGIRRDLDDRRSIPLPDVLDEAALAERFWRRRTHRRFALRPIPLESFAGFLTALRNVQVHGQLKSLYASPGGHYPTQIYLYVKPGRVDGVDAGTYYYHPDRHELVELERDALVDASIHIPFVNAPVFEEAAFSVFFVVELDAIGPAYGPRSLTFATLETGVIAATLELTAAEWDIGLCQIGDIKWESVKDLFRLTETHRFIHSLVGGLIASEGPESRELVEAADEQGRRERLADRIRDLDPEEVRHMLEAHEGRDAD